MHLWRVASPTEGVRVMPTNQGMEGEAMTTVTQTPKSFMATWRHLAAAHAYTIKQLKAHVDADEDLMTLHDAAHHATTMEHGHTA